VPLSGAARYRGNGADVDLYVFGPDAAPIVCEVKARASGEGFATLARWLGDSDALFLRRDRADPLVVCRGRHGLGSCRAWHAQGAQKAASARKRRRRT
jgi:hypothetical protein